MKRAFWQGAFILSLAGVAVKILGALYRIPLARILGGEGMGLYQMAYPIYTSILALSTAGLPVAISRLVAEKLARKDFSGAKRVFRISLAMFALIGLIFSFLVLKYANILAEKVLQDARASYALLAISPAIFFTAIVSAFRGYFQGYQEMLPTAVSQVIEQLTRVITVLAGAIILLPHGLEFAAAGATFGATTGGLAALLCLIGFYVVTMGQQTVQHREREQVQENVFAVGWQILRIAFPLSIGGLAMPLLQGIDALIVPLRLRDSGLSPARATELFGQLTGMAGSLVNLPAIITTALAVSLVPAVSEALVLKEASLVEGRIRDCLRLTVLFCLPAAAGLSLLATPICQMLYDLPEAGLPLNYLAPSVLFLGLYQATSGALQGLNQANYPVFSLITGLGVKSFLNYSLTAMPALNIKGPALASVAAFFVAFVLNFLILKFKLGVRFKFWTIIAVPLFATGLMVIGTKCIYELLLVYFANGFATLGSIIFGMAIYFFSLLILGYLREEDLSLLPALGPKLAGLFKKLSIKR